MKIFTVRHGRTHWNVIGRMQGHTDIELDEVGLDQATRLGTRLAGEKVGIIYSSDLLRAARTAEAINSHHNVELVTTPALRELGFGVYEGRYYADFAEEIDYHRSQNIPMPGGEDIFEYFNRIHAFLDEITASNHRNIIIVGHYGTVRAAICYFLQIPTQDRERFHIDNTAVHCFERGANGKFSMILENDTSHLDIC